MKNSRLFRQGKKPTNFSKVVGSLSYPAVPKTSRQNLSWWSYHDMKKGTRELRSKNISESLWSKWENISNCVLNRFSSIRHYFHQWHYERVYLFHVQVVNWKQLEEPWRTLFRIQNNRQIEYIAWKIPNVWLDVNKCNKSRIVPYKQKMWLVREELRKLRRDGDVVTLIYAKEATKKKRN